MNTSLVFKSPQFGEIRTAGSSDQPLFCLADVCRALDIKNSRDLRSRLDAEDVVTTDTLTEGGVQSMTFVTEVGLYEAIFISRKPEAKVFRKWVTSEVLPSIRKTGGYRTEEVMALRAQLDEANRTINRQIVEFRQLNNVYRAVADTLDDSGTLTEKLSFLIHKVSDLIAYNKEVGRNVGKILDAQCLGEVDFSGVSIGSDLLEVLRDIIVDYPLCASESEVADMETVNHNVKVLNSLYAVLRNHFGRTNESADLNDSLICK